jgi:hypothetical protein
MFEVDLETSGAVLAGCTFRQQHKSWCKAPGGAYQHFALRSACAPALQDALEQLMALPYDAFERGPPTVPCNKERLEYMQQIKALDATPRDPQVRVSPAHSSCCGIAGPWASYGWLLQPQGSSPPASTLTIAAHLHGTA